MNFEDSPKQAAYRAEVRAWIEANKPDFGHLTPEERRAWHPAHKEVCRQWQATKADAGYACISWPKEWGGAGGSAIEETIFLQEEQRAGMLTMYFSTGLRMLLPAIMEHNDDELSRSLIPPAVRGDTIWCQLFSEPSSGSDSAGARCMAVKDGDEGVINGQKVWNSGAFHADYGMLVTRTDPDVPKHKGMSVFWLDMKTPGVEVRPIRMMSSDNELNEVFLTDVRIPANQMVGEEGDGWKVILTTLSNERSVVGSGTGLNWRDVVALAREIPDFEGTVMDDPAFREWLAEYYVNSEAIRLLSYRTLTALTRGEAPDGGGAKVLWANQTQEMTSQALDFLDRYGLIEDPAIAPAGGAFQHRFLWAPGLRLGGGSDEIMKNIIAERVLGLPGDIRLDKGIPFREIPYGR